MKLLSNSISSYSKSVQVQAKVASERVFYTPHQQTAIIQLKVATTETAQCKKVRQMVNHLKSLPHDDRMAKILKKLNDDEQVFEHIQKRFKNGTIPFNAAANILRDRVGLSFITEEDVRFITQGIYQNEEKMSLDLCEFSEMFLIQKLPPENKVESDIDPNESQDISMNSSSLEVGPFSQANSPNSQPIPISLDQLANDGSAGLMKQSTFQSHGSSQNLKRPRLMQIVGKKYVFEKEISEERLQKYIDQTHYREIITEMPEVKVGRKKKEFAKNQKSNSRFSPKAYRKFSCCRTSIGSIAFRQNTNALSKADLEVGCAITIFFRQLKLAVFAFFLMTILCIPKTIIIIFGSNEGISSLEELKSFDVAKDLMRHSFYRNLLGNLMFDLSLASLGKSDFPCEMVKVKNLLPDPFMQSNAKNYNQTLVSQETLLSRGAVQISCNRGQISHLIDLGLTQQDSMCPSTSFDDIMSLNRVMEFLSIDTACHFQSMNDTTPEYQNIKHAFQQVQGKISAKFELDLTRMMDAGCLQKIKNLNYLSQAQSEFKWEPSIIMLVQCTEEKLFNPFTRETTLTRKQLLSVSIAQDFFVVLVFALVMLLQNKNTNYAYDQFREASPNLQTRDFAIQISRLPPLREYKHQQILKVLIWDHLTKVIKETPQQLKQLQRTQKYQNQIVDIFFGCSNYGREASFRQLASLHQRIGYLNAVEFNTSVDQCKAINKLESQIERAQQKFIKLQNQAFEKEQKEMYNIQTGKAKVKVANESVAFVIFRSMEGRQRVLSAYYRDSKLTQISKRLFGSATREQAEIRDKTPKFLEKYELKVEPACDPHDVVWKSFVKSKPKLCCSWCFHQFLKIIFCVLALYLIWAAERLISQLETEYPIYVMQNPAPSSSKGFISASAALNDHYKGQFKQFEEFDTMIRQGLLSAYCYQQTNFNKSVVADAVWFPRNETAHCQTIDLYQNLKFDIHIAVALVIAAFNQVIIWIYSKTAWTRFKHTFHEQQLYQVNQSLYATFFNTALLIIVTRQRSPALVAFFKSNLSWLAWLDPAFNGKNLEEFMQFEPILTGPHVGLTVVWYQETAFLISAVLGFHIAFELLQPWCILIKHKCKRSSQSEKCCCCRRKVSQLKTQKDLNALHTGHSFNLPQQYISFHLVAWTTLLFGTVLPLLFPMALIYFVVSFMTQKYMIVHFYRRSEIEYSEQLAMKSIGLLKFPILLHCLISILVHSDGQIFHNESVFLSDITDAYKIVYAQNKTESLLEQEQQKIDSPKDVANQTNTTVSPQNSSLSLPPSSPNSTATPSASFNNHIVFLTDSIKQEYPELTPTLTPTINILQQKYGNHYNMIDRLSKPHIALMLLIWLFEYLIYKIYPFIETALQVLSQKFRGDGEFEYDEEDDDKDLDLSGNAAVNPIDNDASVGLSDQDESVDCKRCMHLEQAKEERIGFIKQLFRMDSADNNKLDREREQIKNNIYNVKTDQSSEEEVKDTVNFMRKATVIGGVVVEPTCGKCSDDFLKEISIETLIFLKERNEQEISKTIAAYSNTSYFNPILNLKPKLKQPYVGSHFKQEGMKKMVQIHKKRRATFRRRLMQVLKKINSSAEALLKQHDNLQIREKLFTSQLENIKRLILNHTPKIQIEEAEGLHEQRIDPENQIHRLKLEAVEETCRIKGSMQVYDYMQSEEFSGVYEMQTLYKNLAKSDINSVKLRQR